MNDHRSWTYDELVAAEHSNMPLDFVLFWGHTPPKLGEIGPHVFSQWWPHDFEEDRVAYPTAEHYMMAEKARLFEDDEALEQVLAAGSPGAAKSAGRRVRGFTDELWKQHRMNIVVRASTLKFGSDDVMRQFLLGTGSQVLVEASPVDAIWGIGMAKDDPAAQTPSQWKGLNLLGFALMQARAALAQA